MFTVEFSKEEQDKINTARAERSKLAEERNAAAQAAYKAALAEVGYDETRLIVYPVPGVFGGATIHRVPIPEAWALVSKRITRALMSDGKKDDMSAAIAGLVEQPTLLVHPALPELQKWRGELPELYSEIHNAMDARCSHGQTTGK